MIDNYDIITPLLQFDKENACYYVMVLKRRKENPTMSKKEHLIQDFYIYNQDDLCTLKDKFIALSKEHNARVYINLLQKNTEDAAKNYMVSIAQQIYMKQYKKIQNRGFYRSSFVTSKSYNKLFLLDYDTSEQSYSLEELLVYLRNYIPKGKETLEILQIIPTLNGSHIITTPFDKRYITESDTYSDLSIHHKNTVSTLLLYVGQNN